MLYHMQLYRVMRPRFRISTFLWTHRHYSIIFDMYSSWYKKSIESWFRFDFGSSVIIFVGYSIPGWALGGVLLVLFGGGSFLDIFPLGGFRSPSEIWDTLTPVQKIFDQIHHMVLPIIAWTIGSFATMTVLMKNNLLENLSQDYVRTAFSKGIKEKEVIWLCDAKQCLIPFTSGIGHILDVVISMDTLLNVCLTSMDLLENGVRSYSFS